VHALKVPLLDVYVGKNVAIVLEQEVQAARVLTEASPWADGCDAQGYAVQRGGVTTLLS
jgi:hypothetical protein